MFRLKYLKKKWKKGYWFITDDETNKDIFLHVSTLEDSKLRILKEDQKVEFDIKEFTNLEMARKDIQIKSETLQK